MGLTRERVQVSSWGYACFLTVNATSLWGGVFPFLPLEFQTAEVTLTYFLTQALAFAGSYFASMVGAYYFPLAARRMLVVLVSVLVFGGSACLIAAMYISVATLVLVGGGGILLGVGCGGMFMLWQRYFASLSSEQGNLRLIVGTALAPFIYFSLYLVPIALTAFLVPLIFVPLCGLCLALSVREMAFDQPMFEDIPREHPRVYLQVAKDYWRSALCVGSLALASGVIRGIALLHENLAVIVNVSAMLGSFVSAAVLLILWQRMSFRFGLTSVFRVVYPFIMTGFLFLPFWGGWYLNAFSAVTYLVFSLVQMLMMMQSAQISRDRGINPVFIYGFFGCIAYLMQSAGFLLGWMSDYVLVDGRDWLFFVAMSVSYVLGLTLLVATGTLFRSISSHGTMAADPIEFLLPSSPSIPLRPCTQCKATSVGLGGATGRCNAELSMEGMPEAVGKRIKDGIAMRGDPSCKEDDSGALMGVTTKREADGKHGSSVSKAGLKKRRRRPTSSPDAGVIRDRISKQCLVLQEGFGLSMREAEVMELIARGNSMASISERLIISENTVRTHAKHIYTKLEIHKRQELLDMLESCDSFSE